MHRIANNTNLYGNQHTHQKIKLSVSTTADSKKKLVLSEAFYHVFAHQLITYAERRRETIKKLLAYELRMLIYSRRTNRVNKTQQNQHPIFNTMMLMYAYSTNSNSYLLYAFLFGSSHYMRVCFGLRFESLDQFS